MAFLRQSHEHAMALAEVQSGMGLLLTLSVIFVGELTDRGVFRARVTAFLAVVPAPTNGQLGFSYLVTAEHVIAGLLNAGTFCINRLDANIVRNRGILITH